MPNAGPMNMEGEQAVTKPQGVSRVSRLPRSTNPILLGHQNDGSRISRLPRPLNIPSLQSRGTHEYKRNADGGGANSSLQSQNYTQERVDAPIAYRPSVKTYDLAHSVLDNAVHGSEVNEASQLDLVLDDQISGGRRTRNARPSLSERTIETIAQVPPSPSPSRRRSSITTSASVMPPPPFQTLPQGVRSPQNQSIRSANNITPSKVLRPEPKLTVRDTQPFMTSIPSKATDARFGRNNKPSQRLHANVRNSANQDQSESVSSVTPQRVRSVMDLKASTKRQPVRKASLNFRDVAPEASMQQYNSPTLKRPSFANLRSPVRSETPPSKLKKKPSFLAATGITQADAVSEVQSSVPSLKSSAALRETIAKAKAAKRQVSNTSKSVKPISSDPFDQPLPTTVADDTESDVVTRDALKRRIRNAVSSGILNIAASGLDEVPSEVLRMYDFSENGNQSWSEAVDLTKFIIADNNIQELPETVFPDWSIEELQQDDTKSNIFGGVEVLDFRGNQILSLPLGLRRLERLYTLNISNNKLTSSVFDVLTQLGNLRDLSLSQNELTGTLPASLMELNNLHTLNLEKNKITDLGLAFAELKSLRKLDVSSNLLTNLPMYDLASLSLTDLRVANNQLSGTLLPVDFAMPTLVTLNLSNNRLSALSEGSIKLPQLQSILLDHNQLQSLGDFSQFQRLMTLTASENRLSDLPDGFVTLQQLRTANFDSNSIKVLDPYISKMENLTIFSVTGNPLKDRKYLTMDTTTLKDELAKRLTAVFIKDDASNTPMPEPNDSDSGQHSRFTPEKGVLDLSSVKLSLSDFGGIKLIEPVHSIKLSHNALPNFPVQLFSEDYVRTSLQTLSMAFSSALEPSAYLPSTVSLPNLRMLDMSNSRITSLDMLATFLDAPQLTELNVSCNRLKGPLPQLRKQFPCLTSLLASDNEFTSIAPDSIAGMEVVDVRNNNIEFLPPKIGELGNVGEQRRPGRLRILECSGNRFRVPRLAVVEKGTESILQDLRRMVITDELGDEWKE